MARSDIVQIAKSLLYGPGLGEKPSLRRAAASATVTTSGGVSTFDLRAGEGSKVRAGDILATRNAATAAAAYVLQVLSVATDTVTVVPVDGSATPSSLNDAVFDQNPLVTELALHRTISNIVANWLYPHVFEIDTSQTVTPDLATYQVELPATTREVLGAYQIVSNIVSQVGFSLHRNVHTTISSTGVLMETYDILDSSTIYLSLIKEYTDATTDETIQYLIATGAAALAMDGTVAETQLESTKKDSRQRNSDTAAGALFRSFLTQRQALSEDLSRDTTRLVISR